MKKISFLAIFLVTVLAIFSFATPAQAAGSRMVFSSDRNSPGVPEVFTMDEDGTDVFQVTNLGVGVYAASWIPGTSTILFNAAYGGIDSDLFTINTDGTGLTNLTNTSGYESAALASPDGTKIAYMTDNGGGDIKLYVQNLSNNAVSQVNAEFSGFWWKPDGSGFIVYDTSGGAWQIYSMNADGSNKVALTSGPNNSYFASISPDGTQIAYYYSDGVTAELRVMNSNGSNQITLSPISPDGSTTGLPQWSPDSSKILFTYFDGTDYSFQTIHDDGTGLSSLTAGSALDQWSGAVWGLDSNTVFYTSDVSSFQEIFTDTPTGSNPVNITNSGSDNAIFISASVFQTTSTNTDPETTPPTTPTAPSKPTLAASGTSITAALFSLVLLGSMLGLRAYRTRYTLR